MATDLYATTDRSQNDALGHRDPASGEELRVAADEHTPSGGDDPVPVYIDSTQTGSTIAETAVQEGAWGARDSDLISSTFESQESEIPFCTASEGLQNWRITDSMFKAYTAMRGRYRRGRDLFVWMDRCRKTFREPEECDERLGSCAK